MDRYQSSHIVRSKHEELRSCLEDILFLVKPAEADILRRKNFISRLASILQTIQCLQSATVNPFGSFASNLYSKWGDLDISIDLSKYPNTSTNVSRKRNLLRHIQKALQKTGYGEKFQFIPTAKVPVLVFKSGNPTISCDISIDNYQGHIKSKFFFWLTQIDGRFRDLVLLIKEWAKAHNINNPKTGTLNSFSLCLLIIFHLQTCEPAILPPLREIYDGKLASDSDIGSIFMVPGEVIERKCVGAASKFKTKNRAPLSELLVSFFEKFSGIGTWASQYVICTYSGRWEPEHLKSQWEDKSYELKVEDPFEQTDNAARTVSAQGLLLIAGAFSDTYLKLSLPEILTDRNRLLKALVRPSIVQQLSPSQRHYGYSSSQTGFYTSGGYEYMQPQAANTYVSSRPSSSTSYSRTTWKPRSATGF